MRTAQTILTIIQERGKQKLPLERVYKLLYNRDLYLQAYAKLYSNNGAMTKGLTDETVDSMSLKKIDKIIAALRDEKYQWTAVKRVYIPKKNGKQRPLGLPTWSDKLLQEVIRMILEAYYEPQFSKHSHGFRPNRGCHTALSEIQTWKGTKWFIEGDISKYFDTIDHDVMMNILGKSFHDGRFLRLIHNVLKAGYMENWRYHVTYSGCPQGGIISPILANIYLNELDKYVESLKQQFDKKTPYTLTPEYRQLQSQRATTKQKIERRDDGAERDRLIAQYKELGKEIRKTPAKLCNDKKLKYVRYADDFLIAVNGNKADCEWIKGKLTEFIHNGLKMELSQEKTLITHSNETARFLGYDVRIRRDQQVKPWKNCKQRTMNNTVELLIPLKDKIEKYLFEHEIVCQRKDNGRLVPVARVKMTGNTDLEIVTAFDAELRGLCNYYSLASNYRSLNFFSYLMEYSCLKTLAWKHRCKLSKIYDMYRTGEKRWGVPYDTKVGRKIRYLTKFNEINGKTCEDIQPIFGIIAAHNTNSFDKKLKAYRCELCGYEGKDRKYEIHHVNKVKNLKGKEPWERVMIAKRRKTLVVCHDCHQKIHHGF